MTLKKLPLQLGEEYLRNTLRYCLPTLGESLAVTTSGGGFFALVPDGTPEHQVLQIKSGGILPSQGFLHVGNRKVQEVPNSIQDAVSIIRNKSIDLVAPLFIAHEAQLSEAEMRARGVVPFVIDEQLYWVFDGSWDFDADLKEFIKKSMLSWHFLGILMDGNIKHCPKKIYEHQVEMLVLGAYDGESFIFWTSNGK